MGNRGDPNIAGSVVKSGNIACGGRTDDLDGVCFAVVGVHGHVDLGILSEINEEIINKPTQKRHSKRVSFIILY